MIIARDGHNLQFLLWRRFKSLMFDPQPLDSSTVQFSEKSHYPSFLSCAWRAVDKQVWEITPSYKLFKMLRLAKMKVKLGKLLGAILIEPKSHFDWKRIKLVIWMENNSAAKLILTWFTEVYCEKFSSLLLLISVLLTKGLVLLIVELIQWSQKIVDLLVLSHVLLIIRILKWILSQCRI